MRRLLFLLPFGFLLGCLPPFQGPSPVPIPAVVPTEVCQHTVVPGYRFQLVIPQRGAWSFDWRDSLGNWHPNPTPFWYETGAAYLIETPFTFHVTWAPGNSPPRWFVVSPDISPVPAAPCPDY